MAKETALLSPLILQRQPWLPALFCVLATACFATTLPDAHAEAGGIGGLCCYCHKTTCDTDLEMAIVHSPFQEKNCEIFYSG